MLPATLTRYLARLINSGSLNVLPAPIDITSPAPGAPPSPLAAASLNTPSFRLSPNKLSSLFANNQLVSH
jgi:hypothetical protein